MKTNLEDKIDLILENQKKLERLLLTITPFRRLPVDLQKRAAELQNECAGMEMKGSGEREVVVKRMFESLDKMSPGKKGTAKWPSVLVSRLRPEKGGLVAHGGVVGAVPLSALLNRCAARKVFELAPGDVSVRESILKSIRKLGWKVQTMHEVGLVPGSTLALVVAGKWQWLHGHPEGEGTLVQEIKPVEQPEEETDVPDMWKPRFIEPDDGEEAEKPKKRTFDPAPEDEEPPVWGGIDVGGGEEDEEEEELDLSGLEEEEEEETFETSECAQGLTTMTPVDEDDDVIEEEEDTGNVVDEDDDHGLGPDEFEFHNPIREQFEREAEEAWQRETEALERGDLVLVDGIPVARKK